MTAFWVIVGIGFIPLGYGLYNTIYARGYCAGLRYATAASERSRGYYPNQEKSIP